MIVGALAWGSALNAQDRNGWVHGQLSINAVHFDNFFQAPEGQPTKTLWGQSLSGRVFVPVGSSGVVVSGRAEGIRIPGFTPAFGASVGLRHNGRPTAFSADVSYLWNRPAGEIGDGFGRADMLRFGGEYSLLLLEVVQLIGRGAYRRAQYQQETVTSSAAFEIGPAVRFRGFDYAFSPHVGFLVGRRDGPNPDEAYGEQVFIVGASSMPLGSHVYVSARYRQRVRTYSLDDPRHRNFGRVDRRHNVAATVAIAFWRGLSWTAYYARERGLSSRQEGNFTTAFLSVGLTARF